MTRASSGKLQRVTRIATLPARARDAHKGDFGRILVLGGSTGMLGAPALCANAAFRSGAGLVRVAVEGFLAGDIAPMAPCATFIPYLIHRSTWEFRDPSQRRPDPMAEQQLLEIAWGVVQAAARSNDVLAIGPGWGVDATRHFVLERILAHADRPLVIDADGLNNLARLSNWTERVRDYVARDDAARAEPTAKGKKTGKAKGTPTASPLKRAAEVVLTPHPGEMQRLLDAARIKADARQDREKAAVALARECGAVVVLKGAGTVVTNGAELYVNKTGNPGMATGGTGDVLTGIIAGLIGQRLAAMEAAVTGVHVHGLAGDLCAKKLGQVSMMATDLLEYLPEAFAKVT